MKTFLRNVVVAALASAPAIAVACPATVTNAAKKTFAGATIASCKAEEGSVFEVKLVTKAKAKIEADFDAKGTLLETEEVVAVASVPAAVTKAFAAKYKGAVATRAEKMTKAADKSETFELAFKDGRVTKEVTFKADGTFVEEE